jgi:hypothetical protein
LFGSRSSGASLPCAGVQEPQELLQSQENKACRQRESWNLFASTGFWEHGIAAAASTGNQACWLAPSVTHGAAGALGSAYTGMLVSLAFQGEGSRLYSWGSMEPCVPVCVLGSRTYCKNTK